MKDYLNLYLAKQDKETEEEVKLEDIVKPRLIPQSDSLVQLPIRCTGEFKDLAVYLDDNYLWKIGRDKTEALILLKLRKEE
ncbi:MAG TPA: hypothetical protein ENG87_03850 [Candidatus Pacearchaeota archaeon]|nr:hypothetical protein [Candidatus Pacearchaeota archaeon]